MTLSPNDAPVALAAPTLASAPRSNRLLRLPGRERSVRARSDDEVAVVAALSGRFPAVQRSPVATLLKTLLDISLASTMLTLLLPLMAAIAVAVRLSTGGPVLFAQIRVGKGGRLFRLYKFRSMVPGAELLRSALAAQNEQAGPIFKIKHDPRITRLGRTLRKYSLDELPQLLNVLLGDMSLVGPRPPVPAEVTKYEPWQLRRLTVTPGLTCIWQTSGRSRVTFDDWMRMDLAYIDQWSLWLDVKLLAKTVVAVARADGAY